MPGIRIQVLPSRVAGECLMDQLVQQISLRLATDSLDPSGPDQSLQCKSQDDPHRFKVATAVLVPGPSSPVAASTSQAAIQARPTDEIRRPDGPA